MRGNVIVEAIHTAQKELPLPLLTFMLTYQARNERGKIVSYIQEHLKRHNEDYEERRCGRIRRSAFFGFYVGPTTAAA